MNKPTDPETINTVIEAVRALKGNITKETRADVEYALTVLQSENMQLKRKINKIRNKREDTENEDEEESDEDDSDDDDIESIEVSQLKQEVSNLRQEVQSMKDLMKSQFEKLQHMFQQSAEVKTKQPNTFAQILQQSVVPSQQTAPQPIKPLFATVVSLSDKDNIDTNKTISELKAKLDPTSAPIFPSKCVKLSNGKVKINFSDQTLKDQFVQTIAKVKTLKAEEPKSNNPLIFLKGAHIKTNKDTLAQSMKNFNHLIANRVDELGIGVQDLIIPRFLKTNRKRPKELVNIAIQVHPAIRDTIISDMGGQVMLDWETIHAEDMNPLTQCYKCMGFNHISTKCPSKVSTCSHCAGNHEFEKCPNKAKPPTCCNCNMVKQQQTEPHGALDHHCPIYQRMLQRAIGKVYRNL